MSLRLEGQCRQLHGQKRAGETAAKTSNQAPVVGPAGHMAHRPRPAMVGFITLYDAPSPIHAAPHAPQAPGARRPCPSAPQPPKHWRGAQRSVHPHRARSSGSRPDFTPASYLLYPPPPPRAARLPSWDPPAPAALRHFDLTWTWSWKSGRVRNFDRAVSRFKARLPRALRRHCIVAEMLLALLFGCLVAPCAVCAQHSMRLAPVTSSGKLELLQV